MSSSSPAAQSDQPKGPEAPSLAKGVTPDSQAALSEKQPETKSAEKTEDSAVAPATNVQPPPNADSTPGPKTDPEVETGTEPELTTAEGAPIDPRRKAEYDKRLRIDTRLAKFFTWLLLLGFVVIPGTFNHSDDNQGHRGLRNIPLVPLAYVCCLLNAFAAFWFWRRRKSNPIWLYTNVFFVGLINAFSGLITTVVSILAAHDAKLVPASSTAIGLTCTFTVVYAVLSWIYYQKHTQATPRRSRASSEAV